MLNELLADVLPWLAAFLLADALRATSARQAVYVSAPGGHRRYGRGLRLAGIAPWSEVIAVDEEPILLLPVGVGVFHRGRYVPRLLQADDVELIAWEALGEVRATGRKVDAAGRLLFVATSRSAARAWADRLVALQRSPREARPAALARDLEAVADVDALRALRSATALLRRITGGAGAAVFGLVFVLLPAALHGPLSAHLPVPGLLACAGIAAAVATGSGALLLWRCGVRADLASEVLPLVLFPPGAARALPHLSAGSHARHHPAAVAAALLPRPALITRAREELSRIRLSRAGEAAGALAPWFDASERAWARALAAAAVSQEELAAPPAPDGRDSAAFCPLCSAQYRDGVAACADCAVPLVPFRASAPGRTPDAA